MIRIINTENRNCECCGSDNVQNLWQNESKIVRYSGTWVFKVNIATCNHCGFTFTSPSITKEDLDEYHSEGFAGYKEIGLAYDIDTRLKFLKKYSKPDGKLVEIGGDMPDFFHQKCNGLFKEMFSVDIASDIDSKVRDHGDLENDSVDVVTHYDVLEHVLDVRNFLKKCANILKTGGLMICEMPNIHLYSNNLVLLECEHVNHFSVKSLSKICSQVGLELIESSDIASRPHGFTAIFRKKKSNNKEDILEDKEEVKMAIRSIEGGIKQVDHLMNDLNETKNQILDLTNQDKIVTIWAVTEVSRMLLNLLPNLNNIKIVDSDPRRKEDLLETNKLYVNQPKDSIEILKKSSLIVISAPRYFKEINDWIDTNVLNKSQQDIHIKTLATDKNGKPLT